MTNLVSRVTETYKQIKEESEKTAALRYYDPYNMPVLDNSVAINCLAYTFYLFRHPINHIKSGFYSIVHLQRLANE